MKINEALERVKTVKECIIIEQTRANIRDKIVSLEYGKVLIPNIQIHLLLNSASSNWEILNIPMTFIDAIEVSYLYKVTRDGDTYYCEGKRYRPNISLRGDIIFTIEDYNSNDWRLY